MKDRYRQRRIASHRARRPGYVALVRAGEVVGRVHGVVSAPLARKELKAFEASAEGKEMAALGTATTVQTFESVDSIAFYEPGVGTVWRWGKRC